MADKTVQYRDGWNAHKNGVPVGANPYHEVSQEASFAQWQSGWCDRFGAVKHGLNVDEGDNECDPYQ